MSTSGISLRMLGYVAIAALALSACGSVQPGAGPSSQLATSSLTTTSASTSGTTQAAGHSGGPEKCTTPVLSGKLEPGSPGAGQRYASLLLTNTGGKPCTIYGYGGLELIGADGKPLPTNLIRTPDPAPVTVTLAPGRTATKNLHWSVVPGEGEPDTGPCQPEPAKITVIPPDETRALTIGWTLGVVCGKGTVNGSAYHAS